MSEDAASSSAVGPSADDLSALGAAAPSQFDDLRLRVEARIARAARWEFWPAAVVYGPLVPWLLLLALRHRGPATFTAANPAIPMGGVVGESKWRILSLLPPDSIVPTALVPPAPTPERAAALDRILRERGWAYPIVLKPDVGERGAGVRLMRTPACAHSLLAATPEALIAQTYHPGPYEAGIFYVRDPAAPNSSGRIFSITDKRFPSIVGDGRSSLRALILRHPRYRLQHSTFLRRLGDRAAAVPASGVVVPLAVAGNHCQGTTFLDGSSLATPALSDAIDQIARHAPGLFFGRFDVRYADPDDLRAGRGFAVLELNGVLSEATDIYDPSNGFWAAQRTLREQWRLAFEIGAANRARGHAPARSGEVLRAVLAHLGRAASRASD